VTLLLCAYPRGWRERYGDELLALLEAEPVTWRVRVNLVLAGLQQRLTGSRQPQLRVLWAWSLFVIGGMAFQKTSEHWQAVVPRGDRGVPTAAFDTVQITVFIGTFAILGGVVLALPAFRRDLQNGGWSASRRTIGVASVSTTIAVAALVSAPSDHAIASAWVVIAFAVISLFSWTRAATVAAGRLPTIPAHRYLVLIVTATMLVVTIAAAFWFTAVVEYAPAFVGAAQLVVGATFMLAGTALAMACSARSLHA
jgi:hypothetical protein